MKNCRLKNFIRFGLCYALMALGTASAISRHEKPVIAITQIVPHPSLDLIRKGIEEELATQKIECTIQFESAQGNIALATQIAQKFVSLKPAIIVPISTPSAQIVYAAAKLQNIPVVFAAVNDPVSAKLVPSMDKAGKGVTGVSDFPPVADQVALIQEILPNVKKIGVVYSTSESNSEAVLCLFEKMLKEKKIILLKAGVTNMMDVPTATKSLVGNVDAIYIPNDNTVVAALESLIKITQENKVPVFSADPESVKQGCLCAVSHSQDGLGRQTGKMVARVLKGEDIQNLAVETPAEIELSLNQDVAKSLDIAFPKATIERAKYIIKKEESVNESSS